MSPASVALCERAEPDDRELMPDPIYRSVVVTQVVNKVLLRGKRSVAEHIVYDALEVVKDKASREPDKERTERMLLAASKRGLLLLSAGLNGNVIRTLMPLTIPDEQLLEVAGQGRLHERAVLQQQVRRMLHDPKADGP